MELSSVYGAGFLVMFIVCIMTLAMVDHQTLLLIFIYFCKSVVRLLINSFKRLHGKRWLGVIVAIIFFPLLYFAGAIKGGNPVTGNVINNINIVINLIALLVSGLAYGSASYLLVEITSTVQRINVFLFTSIVIWMFFLRMNIFVHYFENIIFTGEIIVTIVLTISSALGALFLRCIDCDESEDAATLSDEKS